MIYRFSELKIHENKRWPGRPQKLSDHDKRIVIRTVKMDLKISAPKIAQNLAIFSGVRVSGSTIRSLLKNSGYMVE